MFGSYKELEMMREIAKALKDAGSCLESATDLAQYGQAYQAREAFMTYSKHMSRASELLKQVNAQIRT